MISYIRATGIGGLGKRRNEDVQQKFASFCSVGLGVCGQVIWVMKYVIEGGDDRKEGLFDFEVEVAWAGRG
jgi:hypothetical protein